MCEDTYVNLRSRRRRLCWLKGYRGTRNVLVKMIEVESNRIPAIIRLRSIFYECIDLLLFACGQFDRYLDRFRTEHGSEKRKYSVGSRLGDGLLLSVVRPPCD